tara:strand:- start:1002 stop:1292 length:291 start_codon:yes stop_codon:yes gene_type:complete
MAKFISIKSSAAGIAGGNILIGAGLVTGVVQNSDTTVVIYLAGGAAGDLCTITHDTTGAMTSVRDAVNYALTANPGGVKAQVHLPEGILVTGIAFA